MTKYITPRWPRDITPNGTIVLKKESLHQDVQFKTVNMWLRITSSSFSVLCFTTCKFLHGLKTMLYCSKTSSTYL